MIIYIIKMNASVQHIKETLQAIVKVSTINKKILFYSADNLNIPRKVISTKNLKAINLFNVSVTPASPSGYYITNFEYKNDDRIEQVIWKYAYDIHNWESETIELINKTIKLA
jgi:hypothetical protein